MFREMRRKKQILSEGECIDVLQRGTSGVLAVSGDEGYPYAVPLSYAYHDSKIFFHCAKTGHKIDSIAGNEKASFCVIDKDSVVPEEYTSYFRSVIVFGKARIIEDEAQARNAIERLAKRYSPEQEQRRLKEIDRLMAQLCMIELDIEHMSGKEAIELVRQKNAAVKQ